jgi:surface protein
MTGFLPPDSRGLFQNGELQEHNFAESSFTEDDVGTGVTEFDLTNVDTSTVQDMSFMFHRARSFDQDIGGWDTSTVQDMSGMFSQANLFNQDISGWDTSTVQDMSGMFRYAESFDQDISAWSVNQIAQKPRRFDEDAGFEGVTGKQPNWGDTC